MSKQTDPKQDPPTGGEQDPPATGDPTGDDNGGSGGEAKFSQTDLDRIVAERLERERKKSEAATAKAKAEAEAKALADQQKFEELAEQRGKRVGELETQVGDLEPKLETAQQQIERLEKALLGQLKAMKSDLPEATLELLKKLDPVEQLEHLAKYGEALRGKPSGGIDPTPRPSGQTGVSTDKIIEKKASSGHYAF